MTEFVSEVKTIPHSDENVFRVLSDLNKLELVKDKVPQDKIKDFKFDSDSCSFNVSPVGEIRFNVIEREPNKLVKFQSANLPFETFLWIQLVSKDDNETKLKITVRSKINSLMKGMVSKPLQEGIDKIADLIASLPYDTI